MFDVDFIQIKKSYWYIFLQIYKIMTVSSLTILFRNVVKNIFIRNK